MKGKKEALLNQDNSEKNKEKPIERVSKTKKEKKGKVTKVRYESVKEIKVDRALVENFVDLQKVLVALSSKLDKLSERLSNFLSLLEESAKNFAKKEFESASEKEEMKKILEKLDKLSEQAGLIGKGLALIHEANLEKTSKESYTQTTTPYKPSLVIEEKSRQIAPTNINKFQEQKLNMQNLEINKKLEKEKQEENKSTEKDNFRVFS
ncbi:MAG: hypothetical protein KatS3mg001_116 [Candidatus Pacearchaeota archaeon]|nr:MAG: hypothetical protein KatS3mg001_116 [Candidatus Pacearchaeota archaeon]